ncbi:hypothetical protein AB685_15420 [Bacillus sp. LL01]|uniref:hypothetical protein n=1 Tax=Bacillus sp. LL01 TaxID=1665556 RepID=UPI00064CDF83|nr:hypothetical protein [Bacillus sp. LL01]KMJ57417.1 hypothetical protein AB685_15420 [Bacillus sp. LL01]
MRLYLFGVLLFLTGCESTAEEVKLATAAEVEKEVQEKVVLENGSVETYSINGQTFEIIPYHQSYLDFMEVLEATKGDREELFLTHVVKPFSKEIHGHEYYGIDDVFYVPPVNTAKLREMIIQLDDQYQEISRFIKEGLKDSTGVDRDEG